MNINDPVWVELTPAGKVQLREYLVRYSEMSPKESEALRQSGKFLKFQLWELMLIFGPKCYMGGDNMFVNNQVYLVNPNLS